VPPLDHTTHDLRVDTEPEFIVVGEECSHGPGGVLMRSCTVPAASSDIFPFGSATVEFVRPQCHPPGLGYGANVIADPYGVVRSQRTATLERLRSIRASAAKLLVEESDELSPATG
jgi:hypothetical protein